MSDETPRLRLPQLVSQQEMSNVTWNEALAQLDALVDLLLLGQFVDTPPANPQDGDAWLIGGAPTGAWTGYAYKIATRLDGAWRFYAPFNGLRAFVAPTSRFIVYQNGTWTDWNALLSASEVSIASAAACDLGAAGSLFVQITGTTAISSFGAAANRLRYVRFAQALTLTHNATSLVLLGGANRTTAAGDVGIYASDASGNWRERGYFRAAADAGDYATRSGSETLSNKTLGATQLPGGGSLDGSGNLKLPLLTAMARSDMQASGWTAGQTVTLTKYAVTEPFVGLVFLNSDIYTSSGEAALWLVTATGTTVYFTPLVNNTGYAISLDANSNIAVKNNTGGNRTMTVVLLRVA